MKYLTIIRHAKSDWSVNTDDFNRPLNERGKRAIPLVGQFLKNKNIQPDFILSSSAKRAKKTAEGICKSIHHPTKNILFKMDIYAAGTKEIIKIIKEIDDYYSDVFLFGHEPVLSSLIEILTQEKLEKFPTCAVYRIAFNIHKWKDVDYKNAKCEFYVNPKLLLKN
jgi:phosphohistidine phosphatase